MSDIKEKISALYDGELDNNEIDDLLKIIDKDPNLQEQLSLYGLAGLAVHKDGNNIVSIDSGNRENKSIFSNLWFSNGLTAAASILLTLFIINNVDISRMNISEDSTNKIASAINSPETKDFHFISGKSYSLSDIREISSTSYTDTAKEKNFQ